MTIRSREDQSGSVDGGLALARFLVVDDSPAIRLMIQEALVQSGVDEGRVEGLPSGDEALRRFSEFAPDVVFLDTSIPGVDPFDAAQAMILEKPSVSVVAVTELDPSDAMVRELLSFGVFDVIEKPVRVEDVRALLDELQSQHRGAGRIR